MRRTSFDLNTLRKKKHETGVKEQPEIQASLTEYDAPSQEELTLEEDELSTLHDIWQKHLYLFHER